MGKSTAARWIFICVVGAFAAGCGQASEAAGVTAEAASQQSQALGHHRHIVNGQATAQGAFAAVGALLMRGIDRYGDAMGTLCTGTLIAPDVVLSAAHCVEPGGNGSTVRYYFSLAEDVALAGQHPSDIPGPTYEVREAVAHPAYAVVLQDGLARANDVSLLFLSDPVPGVTPSQLLAEDEASLQAGTVVSIVGYGLDGPPRARRPGHRLGIKRDALSMINEIGTYEMQVGDRAPVPQKCLGDSGGPTYVVTPEGERLAGVTSRAYDRSGCMRGGVDTLIAPLRPWLLQTLAAACADGRRVACGSLVAQGIDGIEAGGTQGGVKARQDP